MNFLAHLYLAPENEDVRLGCFIADAVKGSRYLSYSPDVQTGIMLHRRQDDYTDKHAIVKECVKALRPAFHLFANVVMDIYVDHFLAKNWIRYSEEPLSNFAERSYGLIDRYKDTLPEKIQQVFHYMKQNNWLENYKDLAFLQHVFSGMSQRTSFKSNMCNAVTELEKQYNYFESQFEKFFNDCIAVFS